MTCQQRMPTPLRHLTLYTPGICRGSCKPDFYCGLFHSPDLDTDLDCRYSVYLTGHTDFDCGLFHFPDDTSILTIEFCSLNGAHSRCDQSTGDAYSLTPDPTSGFFRGACLTKLRDLYFIHTGFIGLITVRYISILFWRKRDDSLVSFTAIYILNLEFWNFNQKPYTGLASEYCIEIAKDSKGCKIHLEKVPFLIF